MGGGGEKEDCRYFGFGEDGKSSVANAANFSRFPKFVRSFNGLRMTPDHYHISFSPTGPFGALRRPLSEKQNKRNMAAMGGSAWTWSRCT